jgi:hypothetical protein
MDGGAKDGKPAVGTPVKNNKKDDVEKDESAVKGTAGEKGAGQSLQA